MAEAYRITVKDDALGVTCAGTEEEILTFDRAGRLFAAWIKQRFYRRGLDGRVLEKHSTRDGARRIGHRRILAPQEADRLIDHAASGAAQALSQLARGEADLLWTASSGRSLGEALRLTAAAAAFDAEAAHQLLLDVVPFVIERRTAQRKDCGGGVDQLAVFKLLDECFIARFFNQLGYSVHRALEVPYFPVGGAGSPM